MMSPVAYFVVIERWERRMTGKETEAAVMVIGSVVISGWLAWDAANGGVPATLPDAAWKVLWAILYSIIFNIVAVIVGFIIVSIAQREELKDERADEREHSINARSMVTAYMVLAIGVLGVLFWQAFGLPAHLGPYALFGISMLAGAGHAATKLVLYRIS
jgi:heme/copper-type cytochrome/quinol oxidase subunit 2